MAPTIEILATVSSLDARQRSGFMRILYTDTVNGRPVKSIRYVRVLEGALPSAWTSPATNIKLPEFPVGDWDIVDLVPDETKGGPAVSNPRRVEVPQIQPWHRLSVDYFALQKLFQIPFVSLNGRRSDTLWMVRNDALPAGTPALMKIAEVPPLDLVKAETEVYRMLDGKGAAPQFLGHITENDRIIGFMTEFIQDVRPAHAGDFEACRAALAKLHAVGYTHGDVHSGNFLIKPDGPAMIIDFEYARKTSDEATFEAEMRTLEYELLGDELRRNSE